MFVNVFDTNFGIFLHLTAHLTRSLREPGGPRTKSMEVSESCMERVKSHF